MRNVRAVEFWSSVESHGCQKALIDSLRNLGWSVHESYAVSAGSYRGRNGTFGRVIQRLGAYLIYPMRIGIAALGWRSDTIYVVSSNTFYAPWIALIAAKRDVSVVHWVLDLYPEALGVAKVLRPDGVFGRFLGLLMWDTCRRAAANVFLGEGLLRFAWGALGGVRCPVVIPIGADDCVLSGFEFRPLSPGTLGRMPKVLYCGNMGAMHEVDTLAALFEVGAELPAMFEFRGHGKGLDSLRARTPGASSSERIVFGASLSDREWCQKLEDADIALVTMRPGAEFIVMPSKTYSSMLAGQAILAICPAASDLAQMIRCNDIGWIVEPGDVVSLRNLIFGWCENREEVAIKRRNSHSVGWRYFRSEVIAEKWIATFGRVQGRGSEQCVV